MGQKEEPTDAAKLYLVDGSNYLYRAFYAIPDLSNSQGFPTNAIYGFTLMLLKLLKTYAPSYIAVCFDVKGPTFRHEAYADYKATRRPIPDALIPQIPYVKEISRALGCTILEQEGIEADDIIGAMAVRFASPAMDVVIVSGDKDLLQLVSDHITVIDTMKDKRYDVDSVRERFGVEPAQMVDLLALTGDTSDNIPGVPGIGEKGARRLLEEFGSLENILNNLDRVKNARAQAALKSAVEEARLSKELASIRIDVPISVTLEDLRRQPADTQKLIELFGKFEFSSLLQDFKTDSNATPVEYEVITDEASLERLLHDARETGEMAIVDHLSPHNAVNGELIGIGLATREDKGYYLSLSDVPVDRHQALLASFDSALSAPHIAKYGHDVKSWYILLGRQGKRVDGVKMDTMLASYLLNPTRKSMDLSLIAREYKGMDVPPDAVPASFAARAATIMSLSHVFHPLLDKDGLDSVLRTLELPLVPVLASMELHGVLIDTALLKAMSQEMEALLATAAEEIYALAGERFNINSPKQIQMILFERLKLPHGRKTKEGYSTDVDVLTDLARNHELPAKILAYRSLAKLKSTYIDTLPQLVNQRTGRIHTSYNQAVTATGRLSSSNPNLQNIPIRTPEGKRIRQAFIAPPGFLLIAADYSQVELRVLAHLSEDEQLIAAFASGRDIHQDTAAQLFGVFPELVTETMRRQAKVINFGIIYGMSAFGLAKELGIHPKLAQAYIDEYFHKYPGVKAYISRLLAEVREKGYTTTLFNRRRYIPEINSDNNTLRQMAERMAINTPIQGTAADIIKLAMIRLDRALKDRGDTAYMIIQVHDELVLEVKREERDAVIATVKEVMEHVVELKAPLKVEIGYGHNWDESHG